MTKATIFGDGNMGTAIAGILTAGGATVEHITTTDQGEATVAGDLVILAVPYPALDAITASYGDQLAGKVVVDITNPLNFETFDSLTVPAGSSAAAELAEKLPSSRVLKAFNTTFAATLTSKTVGDNPTTVLIAGDDAEAKSTLADGDHRRRRRGPRRRWPQPGPRARGARPSAADPRGRWQGQLDRRLRPGPLSRG